MKVISIDLNPWLCDNNIKEHCVESSPIRRSNYKLINKALKKNSFRVFLERNQVDISKFNTDPNILQLKDISEYIERYDTCEGTVTILKIGKLRADGLNLSELEAHEICGIRYGDRNHRSLPFIVNGKVKDIEVNPILESLGEAYDALECLTHLYPSEIRFLNKKKIFESIFRKFGCDPEQFLNAALLTFTKEQYCQWKLKFGDYQVKL